MSYPKLRGLIREKFGTQEAFAAAMDRNAGTISNKLSGKTEWTRADIERACELLDIPLAEAYSYFFCVES